MAFLRLWDWGLDCPFIAGKRTFGRLCSVLLRLNHIGLFHPSQTCLLLEGKLSPHHAPVRRSVAKDPGASQFRSHSCIGTWEQSRRKFLPHLLSCSRARRMVAQLLTRSKARFSTNLSVDSPEPKNSQVYKPIVSESSVLLRPESLDEPSLVTRGRPWHLTSAILPKLLDKWPDG